VEADLLAGRYELGDVIGRGRSPVYAARDTRLGREVAVKRVTLAPGPDEVDDVRARAQREARAAARLATPHVVIVFDVVEEPDAVWLVMELVRAPSLAALVRKRGPLPPALAARIGLGVLDALVEAHAVGVLHRDVKPANVLVSAVDADDDGDDGSLCVKLTDFGVAALRDESGLTLPGVVVGSPSYMAPEQASGDEVGPAADLWALGALLYFAVEGVPPFARGSALATAAAVVHGTPRPHHHPGALTPLIDALLTKDPARRPDAAAVRATLRALAAAPAAPGPATTQTAAAAGGSTQTTAAVGRPAAGRRLAPDRRARPHRRRAALAAAAIAAVLTGAAGLLLGVGGDPGPAGPPAADAQTTSLPAGAGPATTAAPVEGERRAATPSDVAVDPSEVPAAEAVAADPGGAAASAGAVSGPAPAAGPTTTTTPDPSDPPSDPSDPPASTTTTTAPPDPEVTTPPTTVSTGE
jgi:eukaryotic-like serine/threonine-protein kinase